MIDEFTAEVYSGGVWNPLDLLGLTLEEALDFGKPTTAKLTLDNFQGNMRQICTVGNQIRLIRNSEQIYHGIINTPAASVGSNGFLLNLDTTDYYIDKLMKKQTGDAYIWDFIGVTPADLFRCFIGTKFIVQEPFASYRRIDDTTINNLCVINQTLQLVKNGSTYQPSGSLYSKTLQNSSDWDDMGNIQSVAVTIDGTSQLVINNLLTNSGFESDLTGWDVASDNYDISHTDTATADFDAGIKTNVNTANDEVKLTKTGTNLSYTETTTSDFNTGTLNNLNTSNDELKLIDNSAGNQSHTDTTTADFDAGTKINVSGADNQLQLAKTGSDHSKTYTVTSDFNAGSHSNTNATNNDLELNKTGSDYSNSYSTTAQFNQGTPSGGMSTGNDQLSLAANDSAWLSGYKYRKTITITTIRNVWWCRWWKRNSGNVSTFDYNQECYEELNSNGHLGYSNYNPGGQADYYNARFETNFYATATGTYTFYANSDDAVRMWVNGVQIINSWTPSAGERSGSISLTAGNWYPVVIEHYEYNGSEGFTLQVEGPGITKQNVPASWIYWCPPTQTDYTVRFYVYKGSGTDDSTHIYLNDKCLSWTSADGYLPNDVRFTTSDKTTKMTYSIEGWNSTYAVFAVKIPSLASTTTLYIYYGKSNDTHESSNAAYLHITWWGVDDRANWTMWGDSGAPTMTTSVDTTNGYFKITNTQNYSYFAASNTFNTNYGSDTSLSYMVETNCYKNSDPSGRNYIGLIVDAAFNTPHNYYRCTTLDTTYPDSKFVNGSETPLGQFSNTSTYADQRWITHRVYRNRATGYLKHTAEYNGTVVSSSIYADKSRTTGSVGYHSYGGESWYNIIRVMKWVISEPWWYSSGAETSHYATSGSWTSDSPSIASVSIASNSSISWTQTLNGGSVTVQASIDGTNFYNQTSGQPIVINGTNIANNYNLSGKTLTIKVNMTGTGWETPVVDNIAISITSAYYTSGYWISDAPSISAVGNAVSSLISWSETLNGGTVTVQASVDGTNFYNQTSGQPIVINGTQINNNYNCTGKTLTIKVSMTGTESATPIVDNIAANVSSSYYTSGTWTSPADNFNVNSQISSSTISWTPGGTGTITVQTKVGSNDWKTASNGGAIQDLTDNMGSTTIQVKITLSGSGTTTPTITDITKTVNLYPNYVTSGVRIRDIDISSVGKSGAGMISWTKATPTNTTIIIETSLDGGATYQPCTSGSSIPGITVGYDCTGKTLRLRETLTTTDTTVTPVLYDLSLSLTTEYYPSGSIILPDLNVNVVGQAASSSITWTETKPSNTFITIQTSFDGIIWTNCTNGGAIPNVNGQDMTGKVIKIKVLLSTTDHFATPILSDITVTLVSNHNEVVEISTTHQNSGSKCLHLKCNNYASGTEYGVISNGYQTLTAGQKARAVLNTKGTASTVYLRIIAYDNGNNYLNQQVLTLTNLSDSNYTPHTLDYVLPANTAKVKYEVKVAGTSDFYIDDGVMCLAVDEVKMEVSRDDGTTYYDTLAYYNGSQWTGSYIFNGSESVKNKLKYRITLYAQDSNTKSPLITQIRLDAVTESDTGITEGTIEEWSNPVVADDTITQGFPNMSRHQAITNLIKITGQDVYIDGTGKAYLVNHRGEGHTIHAWNTDDNLLNFNYERIREVMANKLTVIGNGQIDTNIGMNVRWSMKDDESIATYGPIEKTVQERNITDLGAVGARCYTLLQQLKNPGEKLTATLIDGDTIDWEIGDAVNITDNTGSTGVSPLTTYRISKTSRKFDGSGETVAIEFSNVKTELEDVIGATVDLINNYIGTEQANSMPTPATAWTDVDKDKPAECLVWIDPHREVKRIILNVFSRKFRATSKSVNAQAGGGSTSGGGTSHTHSVSWGNHTHSVSWGDHSHTYSTPRHSHYANGGYVTSTNVSGHTHDTYVFTAILSDILSDQGGTSANGGGSSVTSGSGGGGSTTSGADTSHTHTIYDHTHTSTLVYGIYEFDYYAPIQMRINNPAQTAYAPFGTQGSESNNFSVTGFDITGAYNPSGGAGKLAPGENYIYFTSAATTNNPSGLLRLYTEIQIIYK